MTRVWRLLTLRGRLAVRVCALCAALVVADGERAHLRAHAAAGPNGGAR